MSGFKLSTEDIKSAVRGTWSQAVPHICRGVATDSRANSLKNGLFIPLVGDQFDGHDYIAAAIEKGAVAVLHHKWDESWSSFAETVQFIRVENTLEALQSLGAYWRQQISAKVIGLSGSNGKTSTKDFLSQILKTYSRTTASRGSFNNHWGVPLSLLDIQPSDKFAVMEMGMNHPGELTVLNAIARPDIVGVTNVGKAHLGFFKNVDEIALAKKELYESAPEHAGFVFNMDNPWTSKMKDEFLSHKTWTFSLKDKNTDVFFSIQKTTEKGFVVEGMIAGVAGQAEVFFWGAHNIENLAAAGALALAAGLKPKEIWKALGNCQLGWGRSQWLQLKGGGALIFDGYNANPESFRVLIENLKSSFVTKTRCFGIFGEMLELGERAEAEHFSLGQKMATLDWHKAYFFGPSGAAVRRGWEAVKKPNNLVILATYEEFLALGLPSMVREDSLVIVKGSRGQRLERVVELLSPIGFSKKP